MRTQLTGSYSNGSFELRREDGSLYETVVPDQIFRIGNSIGGFWAKPITYAGQRMLALVRIGGSKFSWPIERIRRSFGKERGTILQPGLGLWALSSGAARRGVWHRIRDDADPIRQALRSRGLPSSLVRTVDEIDETIYGSWFHGDGKEEWEDDPDGEHRKHVRGGSFLINSLFEVFVTPNANRMFVAKLVEAGTNTYRDHEKVAAVEIEYGLRCPECKRKGCSVAVHDKERADKAAAEKADREEREAKPIIEIKGVSYRVISHNERRVLLGPKMALETLEGKAMILMAGDEKPYDFTWMLYYHSPNCVTDTKTGQEWYYHISNGRWQKGDGRNIRWYGY